MKKIGLLCLALVLALGTLGVAYAAWTDTIFINGTVNTGSVDIAIVNLSSTWVYKVPGAPPEIVVVHGWVPAPPAGSELIASAVAYSTVDDEVTITINNAFPCVDLTADILVKYEGTIPVKVDAVLTSWSGDAALLAQYAVVSFYWSDVNGTPVAPITGVVQMHEGNYVLAVMSLHLPQDNTLMNKTCTFTAQINATQWNEYPPDS